MQRSLSGGTWTYTRAAQAGQSLPQASVTVLDPAGNESDYNFSGIYVTQADYFEGSGPGKTLLKDTVMCYNDQFPCQNAVVTQPIFDRYYYDLFLTGNPQSVSVQGYDATGLLIWQNDSNVTYPPFTIVRSTLITYDSGLCSTYDICGRPSIVEVTNGGSKHCAPFSKCGPPSRNNRSTQASYTTYLYDQGSPTRGSVTSISRSTSGTSAGPFLTQYYSYNSNGTVATATDPNTIVTYYAYNPGVCHGAFPTTVSVLNLSTSYAYDCRGGVVTSVTDPNNAVTQTAYNDPFFWRPASTTDALGNTTNYQYYPTLPYPGQTESVLTFNGGTSTTTLLNTVDTYGRPWLQQQRQSPSSTNYDTTQVNYDPSGQVQWVTRPFVSNAGVASGGGLPATNYTYDGLGRYTFITDWAGGQIYYFYNYNDVQVTVVGQPAGENPKSRQLEYDALGRLTSVCEITAGSGSGPCSQTHSLTGFFTAYTYDPLSNMLTVNQSGQTRTYTYDGLSRMLSQTDPESGTTNFRYDHDPAHCPGYFLGNEVSRVDAAANVTCYRWDGLHRLSEVNYPTGPNAPNSHAQYYRYDANHWGNPASYTIGRLASAYSDVSSQSYSYNAVGQMTDIYQGAPHGGWFHVQQSYWPNGALHGLQAFNGNNLTSPFTQLFTTTPDGEGRISAIWETNRGYILSAVGYNTSSQPTQVNVIGGSEAFQYDGNSGRMTQWASTTGSYTQTGGLNWNPNGTLQLLTVSGQPNCSYGYDDLARLTGANCGTGNWMQSFGYDVFGNIAKSGSVSFAATYNAATNHVTNYGVTYDTDGNTTFDNLGNSFAYDSEGRQVKVNGLTTSFDAFNRPI
jgi:YD repeat-containing protein